MFQKAEPPLEVAVIRSHVQADRFAFQLLLFRAISSMAEGRAMV